MGQITAQQFQAMSPAQQVQYVQSQTSPESQQMMQAFSSLPVDQQRQLMAQMTNYGQQQPAPAPAPGGGAADLAGTYAGYKAGQALLGGGETAGTSLGSSLPSGVGQVLDPRDLAGFVPASSGAFNPTIFAAGSDAAALGGNIASGLQGMGVGAETAGSIGGALGTGLPIAGAAIGGYNLINNLSDNQKDPLGGALAGAATGASIGSMVPGVGTLIGGGVGLLGGAIAGSFGGNKDKAQLKRDSVRKALQGSGFVDKNWNLNLADGTTFDIGKDGHFKMKNGRHPYEVDFSQEGASDIVGAVNPLAALIAGGDSKLTSDFAGYLTNAILQSKDGISNLKGLYEQAGLTKDSALQAIAQLGVSDATKAAYSAAIDTVMSGRPLQHAGPAPAAPSQSAPKPMPNQTMPMKDPNIHRHPAQINASPVQKPTPKGGALSLNTMGRGMGGMMAPPPQQKKTALRNW